MVALPDLDRALPGALSCLGRSPQPSPSLAALDTFIAGETNGSVEGEATLRSASGDVSVDEANASVTVQTASGDQRLGSVSSGRVTMQSASGDQTVGIRRGSRVRIDVRSMSGDTTSELDIEDAPVLSDGPEVELRATSMSGDVRILRA